MLVVIRFLVCCIFLVSIQWSVALQSQNVFLKFDTEYQLIKKFMEMEHEVKALRQTTDAQQGKLNALEAHLLGMLICQCSVFFTVFTNYLINYKLFRKT